jgi:hypothetical protein
MGSSGLKFQFGNHADIEYIPFCLEAGYEYRFKQWHCIGMAVSS